MELCKDYETMFENIVRQGIVYLDKYPYIESMVVGLSGGIDSTLTAAIAREICDRTGKHKLIGSSIPIESNKKSEIEYARAAGKAFCHEFNEVKFINTLFFLFKLGREVFVTSMYHSKEKAERIRLGNIKARLRMIYLYDKCHRNKGIVLSTDNLSEFYLGFWTLHGDVGDVGFIQQLWKTEVYGLAGYLCERYDRLASGSAEWVDYWAKTLALRKAMMAIPTDGLGITTSDYDQLGVESYQEVDNILIKYLNGDKTLGDHPIIKRHLGYAFKRANPYNISREQTVS
jgi:NAD+ synthase